MDEYNKYENGHILNQKYKFIKHIQTGSFGKVTKAINMKTNEIVALKSTYINPSMPTINQQNIIKISLNEISILESLSHENLDNICNLKESFNTKNYIILVLEYCNDGDLYELLKSTKVNYNSTKFTSILTQLSQIILVLHNLGIYHRDIKPENILFHNGVLKIADFGFATNYRFNNEKNIGTKNYMAPECFSVETGSDIDCVYADYWSMGMTLLFILFGKSLFMGLPKKPNGVKDYTNFNKLIDSLVLENGYNSLFNLIKSTPSERNVYQIIKYSDTFIDYTSMGIEDNDDELLFQMDDDYYQDDSNTSSLITKIDSNNYNNYNTNNSKYDFEIEIDW